MNTATTHIETDKELVPEIRFEGFDGGIVEYLFNDIFLFSTGKNIKQKEASPEFETPCVRYGELYHMYNEVINEVINKTNLEKSELRFSKGDEILLPSAGEDPLDIGSASALTLKNVAIGRTINILRPMNVDVYSQIFASYYINQKLRKKISTLAKGSSISNVYNSDLKTLKINLPSLPEQQKIASFLAAVDEKIQQLSKKKALLENYKKGVMQKLFSGQLRFKDENGKAYPDWEEKRLGELANINMGQSPESKSYNEDAIGLLLIQGNADINGRITAPRQYTSEPTKTCEIGDIILTVRAPVGSVSKSGHNACIGRGVCSIVNNTNSNQEYLFQFLLSYESKWGRLEQGSTFTAVSGKDIRTLKLNTPIVEEQQKIASYLSGIDSKIESVNNQITQTQTFKKGLLQQLFV
jgi:type I restriction enzyme S subunit